MATLQAIGWNLLVGGCTAVASFAAFGAAVRLEWNDTIAPRVWARPKAVIKNVLPGNYWISWVPWALNLSYQEMLDGIPGTGTRQNGHEGPLLKINMDGVILVKFHTLCLKVAVLSTILCMLIVFPLNYTASCDPTALGTTECQAIQNLTNFEITTLAHIPSLEYANDRYNYFIYSVNGRLYGIVLVAWIIYVYTCVLLVREWIDNLALRRVFYLEYDHWKERREELELVLGLTSNQDEFQETRPPWLPHPELRETIPNVAMYSVLFQLPDRLDESSRRNYPSKLDWQLALATNFFDECVPNQPGFSSSVAAVTILPDAANLSVAWTKWNTCAKKLRRLRYIKRVLAQKQREKWMKRSELGLDVEELKFSYSNPPGLVDTEAQAEPEPLGKNSLSDGNKNTPEMTSDQCGDNQTAFPIEGPSCSAQSMLEVPHGEEQNLVQPLVDKYNDPPHTIPQTDIGSNRAEAGLVQNVNAEETGVRQSDSSLNASAFPETIDAGGMTGRLALSSGSWQDGVTEHPTKNRPTVSIPTESNENPEFVDASIACDEVHNTFTYLTFDKHKLKYSEVIGLLEESQMNLFLEDFGVEQMTVYSREYANKASCCPFGCNDYQVRQASIADLKIMAEEAEEDVREANGHLVQAKMEVNNIHDSLRNSTETSRFNQEESNGNFQHRQNLGDDGSWLGDTPHEYDTEEAAIHPPRTMPSKGELRQRSSNSDEQWAKVQSIVVENSTPRTPRKKAKPREMQDGRWKWPFSKTWRRMLLHRSKEMVKKNKKKLKHVASQSGNFAKNVVGNNTYAVVTFTSRQAAIAARQCLADGSGLGNWKAVEDIPIPPLADAVPCDLLSTRNLCRPVTLSINENEKACRRYLAHTIIVLFCLGYTVPLTAASTALAPANLVHSFPALGVLRENEFFRNVLAGLLTGIVWTLFFSICPYLFKAIANFGSGATSVRQAEYIATQYYWVFLLITAFTGTSLSNILLNSLNSGITLGLDTQEVLREAAAVIPTQVAATWLNWIVVRFTSTFPLFYLFQVNTFLCNFLGVPCCARIMQGGGPGGPVPYRIYVDSGVVFLCVVALAPVSPLIAPAALLYFLVFSPMLRWLLIFVYRPDHDGGGQRWPLIFEIFMSAMILAQIFLTTMMSLKRAPGPALLAACALIPTLFFRAMTKEKFYRAYQDAGLLQTSRLDGWGRAEPTSTKTREEFRRWLVDCHKASFVPICLAGLDNFLTAEPAVVVANNDADVVENNSMEDVLSPLSTNTWQGTSSPKLRSTQPGAMFKRVSQIRLNTTENSSMK